MTPNEPDEFTGAPSPGDWFLIPYSGAEDGHGPVVIRTTADDPEGRIIAEFSGATPAEAHANGRLFVAAKRLLAACEMALPDASTKRYFAGCVDDLVSPEWRRLRRIEDALIAAIAEAKGTVRV